MKHLFCTIYFSFSSFFIYAQAPFAVYLVGDAGENKFPGEALLLLKNELLSHPNSAVIFLGDNAYPDGLKKNDKKSEAHLESQLQILKEYKGQVYFIPGNHDWQAQKRNGLETLKDQQDYVSAYLKNNSLVANKNAVTFLPQNGLPGPETILLENKLRLIIIDTQWFLHFHKKNKIGTKANTKKMVYFRLDSLLNFAKQNQEQVIIAAHHPLFTNGKHSKSKQPLRFIINYTPFQLFGLFGLNRLLSQDIAQPRYKKMRIKMMRIFDRYENIIYASGHEHNLQYFKKGANRYIVSGAGSKLSTLRKKEKFKSIFQDDSKKGFVKLDFFVGKGCATTIYRVGEKAMVLEEF